MVSAAEFDDALRTGRGEEPLANLVPDPGNRLDLNFANFPHLHTDHPLDTALQRMAGSGISVLPVVSRTNVRGLLGSISRDEVISAYAVRGSMQPAGATGPMVSRRSLNLMMKAAAAMAGVALLAAVLAHYYRSERALRARAFYNAGNDLIAEGRAPEAVEQFRNALSVSHSSADRQALGLALVAADRTSEAAIYLEDVLRANPNSGAANLGMARVRAREGKIEQSATYYRRAGTGSWDQDEVQNRLNARLEAVTMLDKAGRRSSAQAELLLVVAEAPKDSGLGKRLAGKLVALGLHQEAIGVLREIVQRNPSDGEAWAAIGRAEFALGDYEASREPFQNAAKFGAGDGAAQESAITERLLALNPMLHGLNARARYQRSQQLLQEVADALQNCGAARVALPPQSRPPSFSDATEANIQLAEQLWSQHPANCRPDRALELLLAALRKN
jgi:tetratricopeptide (TPR) repeat protein